MAHSKLAIIGDIHSNATALEAALSSITDYEKSFSSIDFIIFVGDLLTYGVRPRETLCELHRILASRSSAVVLGNHDQMYIDMLSKSSSEYYRKLPCWIKESVDFNLRQIDPNSFLDIKFCPQFVFGDVLVSHANFRFANSGVVDWSYVNTVEDHLNELLVLPLFRFRLGVLGHTHRSRCFSLSCNDDDNVPLNCVNRGVQLDSPVDLCSYSCSLLNAGSIGQPREKLHSNPAWLLVDMADSSAKTATFVSFAYDVSAHLNDISCSGLSSPCIKKLNSYFAEQH